MKRKPSRRWISNIACSVVLLCQACGQSPVVATPATVAGGEESSGSSTPILSKTPSAAEPGSMPSPSVLPATPSMTPEPTKESLMLRLDGWDAMEIRSLCLETSENYAAYTAQGAQMPEAQMETLLPPLLARMGFEVVGPDDPCDAQLQVKVEGWPFDERYNNEEGLYTCFFHGIRGEIVLASSGQQISVPLDWDDAAPERIVLDACENPAQPEEHFPVIWQREVIRALHALWGVEAYFQSQTIDTWAGVWPLGQALRPGEADLPAIRARLADEDQDIRVMAVRLLGNLPDPSMALPDIIPVLEDDSFDVRMAALSALATIGAPAQELVPQLIPLLDDSVLGWLASETLSAITGQFFGQDAQAWQDWWDAVPPAP